MVPLPTLPLLKTDREVRPPAVSDAQRNLLNRVRLSGMACRVAAHTDLFEACALLSLDGEDAKRTYLETFVKCLSDAVSKRIIWFQPGSEEVSFDEAWVLRCVGSIQNNDRNSLDFLLRSRVAPADRRYIGFLMARISEQFPQI